VLLQVAARHRSNTRIFASQHELLIALGRHPQTALTLEPSHLPKLRDEVADFPQLHCFHGPENTILGDRLRHFSTDHEQDSNLIIL